MISCKLMGGLGNFMFQISASYSLSVDNGEDFVIDESSVFSVHNNISTYKNNIFRNLYFGSFSPQIQYDEPHFHHKEIPFSKNLLLKGYFQSEKYFLNHRKELLRLFSIDDFNKSLINKKYNINFKDSCSLHVRRGDYLKYQNIHPTLTKNYYQNCVDEISSKNILIFSDDILWCKKNLSFEGKNIIFIEGNTDYNDLWLMSMCSENIIANSTFSWWGAWLNNNQDKKIFAPKIWFSPQSKLNTCDLIPSEWKKR